MATLILTPEHQIQRLNAVLNKVGELQELSFAQWVQVPHAKSWNLLEVLEHLSIAYGLYEEKILRALHEAPELSGTPWSFNARWWQKFVIEGQRPKGTKRPFKMKTLKRFEPLLNREELNATHGKIVFAEFLVNHQKLKASIIESRGKDMNHRTITSAVGPLVKFYLPEAFFLQLLTNLRANKFCTAIVHTLFAVGVFGI